MNNFPQLGIDTTELKSEIKRLLDEARVTASAWGAVNWGDLGVADIEYRLSMLYPEDGPQCVVIVEEASPDAPIADWLNDNLDKIKFPRTWIECEW